MNKPIPQAILERRHRACKLVKRAVQINSDVEGTEIIEDPMERSRFALSLIYKAFNIWDGLYSAGYTYTPCPYCQESFARYGWLWPAEALV